jgi:uncharacterized membrane protein
MVGFSIVVLALAGLVNALYFTFAYFGRVKNSRWVPGIFCAREGSSCVTVVQTPYARVFGVPNSLLGIVYYLALLVWTLGGEERICNACLFLCPLVPWLYPLLKAASVVTVLLGFYLVYALRRRLHVDCPLCYTAHAINAALLVLLIVVAY